MSENVIIITKSRKRRAKKTVTELMMKLILSVLQNRKVENFPQNLDEETLKNLYALSTKHDIAHIVAFALEKNGLLNDEKARSAFSKQKMLAIFRREQLDFEENRIFALLEEEKIDFLPLKGAVIKNLYPESFMRTSCDIDVLIHEEDLEKAISAITEKLGYSDNGRHFHEHSLTSKSGAHLELHFTVIENIAKLDKVLERIWEFAHPVQKGAHRFEVVNEFLVFHTVAHMEYHFIAGGCGVRPFIDLWLMKNELDFSVEDLDSLLEESQSSEFYKNVNALTNVWFGIENHTELTAMMEEYILTGGVFGSRVNRVSADIHRKGSKKSYVISRIFMPKSELETIYPDLKKHPCLLPFYEVKRWFRLLKKKGMTNAKNEIKANKQRDGENDRTAEMFKELGL